MIHLIYIYFIINAFIAGGESKLSMVAVMVLFGLPIYLCEIAWSLLQPVINYTLIVQWYRLYFTDYYGDVGPKFVEIRRQQYLGLRSNKKENFSRYERFFARQIGKKYNYGITK